MSTLCQRPPLRPHGQLQEIPVGAPMDLVTMDILSGLQTADDGSNYFLVVVDAFTKWVEAYPLPDQQAATCITAVYNGMFSRFGLPRQLHSDQGRNFKSQLVTELCNITGVYKTRTTAFHPRSDGLTERANRTILAMLRAAAYKDTKKWPSKLPSVLADYRMTVHSTTGVTPNRAMHGREVLLPASLILVPPEENMPQSGYKTSRIIFDRHINKFVKPLEVQPKLKRPTLTAEPSVIRSSWVKWSGSTGQDHWYDRSIESSHECGRVLGL